MILPLILNVVSVSTLVYQNSFVYGLFGLFIERQLKFKDVKSIVTSFIFFI